MCHLAPSRPSFSIVAIIPSKLFFDSEGYIFTMILPKIFENLRHHPRPHFCITYIYDNVIVLHDKEL